MFTNVLEAFTLCVAEMERNNITKRTSGGRSVKAKNGGYSGGRVPFGYKAMNGQMVIDADTANIVREIFLLRGKGKTMGGICEILNNEGKTNKSGTKFSISTVQVILGNERTYRGEYKYGNGDWVKGDHEAILTD